jgi:hypothetical protein
MEKELAILILSCAAGDELAPDNEPHGSREYSFAQLTTSRQRIPQALCLFLRRTHHKLNHFIIAPD